MEAATHIPPPMIFAATNWLDISIDLLLVVFVIVCLLMSLLILMQRPKQEGLGAAFGGGVTDQVFGARATNVLQKGTVYLGSLFFIMSLVLAILIGKQSERKSLLEPVKEDVAEEKVMEEKVEEAPASLVDELPVEEVVEDEVKDTGTTVEDMVEDAKEAAPVEESPLEESPLEEAAPVEESPVGKPE